MRNHYAWIAPLLALVLVIAGLHPVAVPHVRGRGAILSRADHRRADAVAYIAAHVFQPESLHAQGSLDCGDLTQVLYTYGGELIEFEFEECIGWGWAWFYVAYEFQGYYGQTSCTAMILGC